MKIFPALIAVLLFLKLDVAAQNLTVDETIHYIEDQIQKYKMPVFYNGVGYKFSLDSVSIKVSPEGYMNIAQNVRSYDFPDNSGIKNSIFDFRDVTSGIYESDIKIQCKKDDCIQELPSTKSTSVIWIGKINKEGLFRIRNAFEYLFDILQYDKRYNQNDKDPFSKNNYKRTVIVDSSGSGSIVLIYDGNISTLTVNIGGIIVTMILDSGASDVSISQDVENNLLERGIITKESYLEPGLYKLADGSVVTSKRLKVPYLKVGGFEVKNVICSVSPTGNVLLLGKSFLDMFTKWSIDNSKHILILEK
jgi:aspartyl protease family protein